MATTSENWADETLKHKRIEPGYTVSFFRGAAPVEERAADTVVVQMADAKTPGLRLKLPDRKANLQIVEMMLKAMKGIGAAEARRNIRRALGIAS